MTVEHGILQEPTGTGLIYDQASGKFFVRTGLTTGEATTVTGLSIPQHDYVELGYTGLDLTSVIYKTGGSGGTVVASLSLTYTGGILQTITKS